MRRSRALHARYGRTSAKRAFHYVARVKGSTPTRFFVKPGESIASAAAYAFAGWARASDMVLWPSDAPGKYTAKWYDKFAERFRESELTIVEEAR